jgi:GAF domain-containing protein
MIERFLRQLSVRQRIIAVITIFLVLSAFAFPLIFSNLFFLTNRLTQVTNVEARADRLLLLASSRLASSRVNLLRYTQDYAPSAYESIDDADQAIRLIEEALPLMGNDDQEEQVASLLIALVEYKSLIEDVEVTRQSGESQDAVQLEFQAYRLGNDIGQQIELIVEASQNQVSEINQTILEESRNRTILIVIGFAGLLIITLLIGRMLEISITRPIAEINESTESFRQGDFGSRVPVMGADELSLLSRTFNQMAEHIAELYGELELRVVERTQDLELRSQYLEASGLVAHAAASILEKDALIQEIVELIQEHFNLYYVGLFEVDETTQWAVLKAGTGQAGRMMLARQHKLRIGSGSMIGWSVYNEQARISLEAGEDPVRLVTAELPKTRSEAAIPLRARGQVIGALTVQSEQADAFNEDLIVVLQTMADQVGLALDNAKLYTEAQEALASSIQTYGQSSQESWQQLLRSQSSFGFSCDESGINIIDDEELLPEERLALTQNKTILGEVDGNNPQTLAIPIKVRGTVIGVLDAWKPGDIGSWSSEEVNVLENITEQLEVALESARLFQDSQRRAVREQLIGEVTGRTRETLDIETVLKTAAEEIRKALALPEVVIRLGQPVQDQSSKEYQAAEHEAQS